MKLTKSVDFTLRMLIYLATNPGSKTTPSLSEELKVPYNHLIKLVQRLAQADIVTTKQGKYGGVQLSEKGQTITVKDVVDVIDGPTQLTVCMDVVTTCEMSCDCQLKPAISVIQDRINSVLSDVTLQDIIDQPKVSV
ncbi:Rrf2 family transcriptional regulator [bacterium]|jgi:Rrf2 family transcriptional regulator, nitric oxide-sensitive transcriptional repressor|nr:Rrf2 family transcriptional regulator [bacterium]